MPKSYAQTAPWRSGDGATMRVAGDAICCPIMRDTFTIDQMAPHSARLLICRPVN